VQGVYHMRVRRLLNGAEFHVLYWDSDDDVVGMDYDSCTKSIVIPSSVDVGDSTFVNRLSESTITLQSWAASILCREPQMFSNDTLQSPQSAGGRNMRGHHGNRFEVGMSQLWGDDANAYCPFCFARRDQLPWKR